VAAVAALNPTKVNEESRAIDKSSFFIHSPLFRKSPSLTASRTPLRRSAHARPECQRNDGEKQERILQKKQPAITGDVSLPGM
jgi:hypothetical protein